MNPIRTLKEKTGQMLVAGFEGVHITPQLKDLVENRHVGGLILFERNFESPEQLGQLIQDLQKAARSTPSSLPLFISVDQEGGRVSRLREPFTQFPHPWSLGKAESEDLAYRFGLALGNEMRAMGINMDYAPVLDVHTNPENPIIGHRAFSDRAEWVARLGKAFIDGFREAGVLAVGKHFPGHGDASQDSHLALPRVDRDAAALERTELVPFKQAIDHGLDIIMTAHVIYSAWDDSLPATFSPRILQGILREQLGFKGLIISDDLEMKAIEDHYAFESLPAMGVEAGVDLFLICHDIEKIKSLQDNLIRRIETGEIEASKVDQTVQRVVKIKQTISVRRPDPQKLFELARSHRLLVDEMAAYLIT